MDFHFGADVRQRSGHHLGELRRLVYDLETRQVVSIVVQHAGFAGRLVLVPIGAVDKADRQAVYLELTLQQFDQMEDYADIENLAPPPHVENIDEDEVTEPVDVPDVPPLGAATGVESIGFTPIVQETVHVPQRDSVVDGHSEVWATDGRVGHVSDVLVDDQTDRVTSFILGNGTEVPMEAVAMIEPNRVVLNLDKARLEAAQHD